MKDSIRVAVVQTSLDYRVAWKDDGPDWRDAVRISSVEESRAETEIRQFLAGLNGAHIKPDIIIFPELSIPLGLQGVLKGAAEEMESIIIAGLDYKVLNSAAEKKVSNEAVLIIPRILRGERVSRRTEQLHIGKTHPAPAELDRLKKVRPDGVKFQSNPTIWLFNSRSLGSFGVAICYDFMDLDRLVLYRNKIQTLFVLAYNKDVTSFDYLAESIARTVFCNVVVCNCGYFGGSVAIAPYRESFKRVVFRYTGNGLANSQIVEIPLKGICDVQKFGGTLSGEFKSLPPGYASRVALEVEDKDVKG